MAVITRSSEIHYKDLSEDLRSILDLSVKEEKRLCGDMSEN